MELGRERAQQSRAAAGVSSLMYRDVQVGGCVDGCVCVHMSQTEMQCKVMERPTSCSDQTLEISTCTNTHTP